MYLRGGGAPVGRMISGGVGGAPAAPVVACPPWGFYPISGFFQGVFSPKFGLSQAFFRSSEHFSLFFFPKFGKGQAFFRSSEHFSLFSFRSSEKVKRFSEVRNTFLYFLSEVRKKIKIFRKASIIFPHDGRFFCFFFPPRGAPAGRVSLHLRGR